MLTVHPEVAERAAQTLREFAIPALQRLGEICPHVVMRDVEPPQSRFLVHATDFRSHPLREADTPSQVLVSHQRFFPSPGQALPPILPDRFQPAEALFLSTVFLDPQRTLVEQPDKEIDDRRGCQGVRVLGWQGAGVTGWREPLLDFSTPPDTHSAASRVKPPAKTDRRRKSSCSAGERRA